MAKQRKRPSKRSGVTVFQDRRNNSFSYCYGTDSVPYNADIVYSLHNGQEIFYKGASYDLPGDEVHPSLGIFLKRLFSYPASADEPDWEIENPTE